MNAPWNQLNGKQRALFHRKRKRKGSQELIPENHSLRIFVHTFQFPGKYFEFSFSIRNIYLEHVKIFLSPKQGMEEFGTRSNFKAIKFSMIKSGFGQFRMNKKSTFSTKSQKLKQVFDQSNKRNSKCENAPIIVYLIILFPTQNELETN